LIQEGNEWEPVPPYIQKNHRATWNDPVPFKRRSALGKNLEPGNVYYRREDALRARAIQIADEMNYNVLEWPQKIKSELAEFDILIVLKPAEPERKNRNRSNP
jgi:hypothetical protein